MQAAGGRGEQRRQALAAAGKDCKLAQLRQAIQALEAKLLDLMQCKAAEYATSRLACLPHHHYIMSLKPATCQLSC